MRTLKEDQEKLDRMLPEELRAIYKEFCQVPVEIALGGKNAGHETIQIRFYMWRKGTPQNDVYAWFHFRGITEWDVKRGQGCEREHGDLFISTLGHWSIWNGFEWVRQEGSPPSLLTYTNISNDGFGEYWRVISQNGCN